MIAKPTQHEPGTKPVAGERMTYEEFLERAFDHNHYEWVEGEPVEIPAVEITHERLVRWLSRLIGEYVELKRLGQVVGEPFQMKVGPHLPGRAPDIMFISNDRQSQLERLCLRGPADLVVEVASPATRSLDRNRKFREYQSGGVGEYWLLDPMSKRAEFFILEEGIFVPAGLEEEQTYRSRTFPEVTFHLDWFWTLPPTLDILRGWKLI